MKDLLFLELDETMKQADVVLDHMLINGLTDIGKKLMDDLIGHLKNVLAVHSKIKAHLDEKDQMIEQLQHQVESYKAKLREVARDFQAVEDEVDSMMNMKKQK